MDATHIQNILNQIKSGELSVEKAFGLLKDFPFENLEFAKIDHHRFLRRGIPEVVYGAGKTGDQLISIAMSLKKKNQPVLITRLDMPKWEAISEKLDFMEYNELARCAYHHDVNKKLPGKVIVCAAGTSDLAVAEEASVTLETMGHTVNRITDVGVAGLHRMLSHLPDLRNADVIIAVAGMEGALPSVIAGLVDCPVIGVPTSVGYGTSFGGVTALLSMLNSCATGVTVVNIDNGFGAGYSATLMLRRQYRSKQ